MFNNGTERAFTSSLLNEKRKGTYHCANCGNLLFDSENSKMCLQKVNFIDATYMS